MSTKIPTIASFLQDPVSGREVNMQLDDGNSYLEVIVSYIPEMNMYNLAYKLDDSLEQINLRCRPKLERYTAVRARTWQTCSGRLYRRNLFAYWPTDP